MNWFPNWSGEVVALLASGPSASREEYAKARGRTRTIAVNCAWTLAEWADMLYACDGKWWGWEGERYGREALRRFPGIKVSQDRETCERLGLRHVTVDTTRGISTERGIIGGGLNGGFQALNLAVQFGARKVILLGFDMHDKDGLHFHANHPGTFNPVSATFRRWIGAFNDAEATLKELGVEVINCTPGSALNVFPKMSLDEALSVLVVE